LSIGTPPTGDDHSDNAVVDHSFPRGNPFGENSGLCGGSVVTTSAFIKVASVSFRLFNGLVASHEAAYLETLPALCL
jgi:hypothetical protein